MTQITMYINGEHKRQYIMMDLII